MNKTPLAFFVGGAVTCAILLAVVTRDRWQGQPSAAQTAGTIGQSTGTAAKATTEVKGVTGQAGTEQSVATTATSSQSGQQQATPPAVEPAKEPEQLAAVEPKVEPVPEPKAESTTKAVEPAQPEDAEPVKSTVKPTFDLITVAPDGLATISGRAEAGARIAVMLDGKLLGNALTNETKTWHLAPEPFLPSGNHNLTATATMPNGKTMQFEQSITVAIDENAEKQPLIVLSEPSLPSKVLQKPEPEPKQTAVATMAAEATEDQQPTVETEAVEKPATAEQEVAAVDATGKEPATTIAKTDPEPKVEQKVEPAPLVKTPKAQLILDTVDYNDTGNIIFSGKADPGGKVRIYVDGQHVGDAVADASGSWVFKGNENIPSGLHQLRIDQVQSDGTVVQRRELPFERADPLKVVELHSAQSGATEVEKSKPVDETQTATITEQAEPEKTEPALPASGKVVIQPGNNLWNISRVIYGSGVEYTAIYEANKDQIRDPDRIYPGQIFTTPGTVPPEEIDPARREPFSMEEKQTQ